MAAVKEKKNHIRKDEQTKVNFTPIVLQQGSDTELNSTETKADEFLKVIVVQGCFVEK